MTRTNSEQQAHPTKSPRGTAYRHARPRAEGQIVVVNLNHPLAGNALDFDSKVTVPIVGAAYKALQDIWGATIRR
jgi:FKBP-type peptidyl-prolyl cis-trans isomerase 2